ARLPWVHLNLKYTTCNGVWNCRDGRDESACKKDFNMAICSQYEHSCFDPYKAKHIYCLPIEKAGDGIIDCLGGQDERLDNYCSSKYSFDITRRYRCLNSSLCVRLDDVCD
ncbi:unnamed protein product, partial [Didymodactylos carnosus]